MRLYYHLVFPHLSNTYLLVSEDTKEGILIDPGSLDIHLVQTIEKNQYSLKGILVTGNTPAHTDGIPTLLRVYPPVQVFTAERSLEECPCVSIHDGDILELGNFRIEVIGMPAYSRESVLYKIGHLVFTGDVLTAGKVGAVLNTFSRTLLIHRLRQYLSQWDPETILFPGYGPPSKAGIEVTRNAELHDPHLTFPDSQLIV
ncbi:MAG: hypothetical protein N2442_13900 [Spirochaetes bacterium]|nr:hypothetical protein [Spirochaetota bacterium]